MVTYELALIIKSEAIFGSGISNVYIHEDCQYDENGFIYYHSKTLKGLLHRTGKNLFGDDNKIVKSLFGSEADEEIEEKKEKKFKENSTEKEESERKINEGKLIFSNLELPNEIKEIVKKEQLSIGEILKIQTNIRKFIKIGASGVNENLRTVRTVKDGIVLTGQIKIKMGLTEKEKRDLLFILKATRNIGLMKNRGRGEVEFKIDYEEEFRKRV